MAKKTKLGKLNLSDLWKGLITAFLSSFLVGIITVLESANPAFDWVTIKPILFTAVAVALGYLIKNFLTNSDDKFLKKEPKTENSNSTLN